MFLIGNRDIRASFICSKVELYVGLPGGKCPRVTQKLALGTPCAPALVAEAARRWGASNNMLAIGANLNVRGALVSSRTSRPKLAEQHLTKICVGGILFTKYIPLGTSSSCLIFRISPAMAYHPVGKHDRRQQKSRGTTLMACYAMSF